MRELLQRFVPSPRHLEITNYSDSRRRSIPFCRSLFLLSVPALLNVGVLALFLWHSFSSFHTLCFRSMKCFKWTPDGLVVFCSQFSSSKSIGSTNTHRLSEMFCFYLLNWAVGYEVKWCRLMSSFCCFVNISLQLIQRAFTHF